MSFCTSSDIRFFIQDIGTLFFETFNDRIGCLNMATPDKAPRVVIRTGAEKSLHRKHPWLFSGAIEKIKGTPGFGDTVIVQSSKGHDLAVGAYSPQSQIRVRIWAFNPEETIDRLFFENKIKNAIEAYPTLPVHL